MNFQDLAKSIINPPRSWDSRTLTQDVRHAFNDVFENIKRITQTLNFMTNCVQNFSVAVGGGLTTLAVTMPKPMLDTNYAVLVQAAFNNGGTWITSKSTTGFTFNWATATVGAQAVRFLVFA